MTVASEDIVIEIEPDVCVGAGNCVDVAADYFDQDPATGLVVLLADRAPADALAIVQEAAELCPVAAIRLRRAAEG